MFIHLKTANLATMKWLLAFLFLFVSLNLVTATTAQDAMTEREKAAAAKKAALQARKDAELRVEADMVTMNSLVEALSKNMGQLHYLRTICYSLSDQKWRDYASRMMNIETAGDGAQRRQLIRAFNAGYYQEEGRHAQCSTAVAADAAALAENGRHISAMLGDPYRER
ncbi:MAG: TIGR02301 family protein [Hellea sp.]